MDGLKALKIILETVGAMSEGALWLAIMYFGKQFLVSIATISMFGFAILATYKLVLRGLESSNPLVLSLEKVLGKENLQTERQKGNFLHYVELKKDLIKDYIYWGQEVNEVEGGGDETKRVA